MIVSKYSIDSHRFIYIDSNILVEKYPLFGLYHKYGMVVFQLYA